MMDEEILTADDEKQPNPLGLRCSLCGGILVFHPLDVECPQCGVVITKDTFEVVYTWMLLNRLIEVLSEPWSEVEIESATIFPGQEGEEKKVEKVS